MEQAPSTFCPKDPDYAERVRASIARFAVLHPDDSGTGYPDLPRRRE